MQAATLPFKVSANDTITGPPQAENLKVRSTENEGRSTENEAIAGNVKAAPAGTGILASRSGNVLGGGMMASRYAPGNSSKKVFGAQRW